MQLLRGWRRRRLSMLRVLPEQSNELRTTRIETNPQHRKKNSCLSNSLGTHSRKTCTLGRSKKGHLLLLNNMREIDFKGSEPLLELGHGEPLKLRG